MPGEFHAAAVKVFDPVPGDGLVRVAILAPGRSPDAPWRETMGVTPDCQFLTSNWIAASVQRPADSPVLNCAPI